VAVEDFEGTTKSIVIPPEVNKEGQFHITIKIAVYNDGVKEGQEGFFVLFDIEQSSGLTDRVSLKNSVVGVILKDAGQFLLCLILLRISQQHRMAIYVEKLSLSFIIARLHIRGSNWEDSGSDKAEGSCSPRQ